MLRGLSVSGEAVGGNWVGGTTNSQAHLSYLLPLDDQEHPTSATSLRPQLPLPVLARMDLAAQMASLAEQVGGLAASNVTLSSQVAELTSTVARLAADNAELASKVQGLTRELSAERMTNIELSRAAAPGGHWIWETTAPTGATDDRGGRWIWSLVRPSRPSLPSYHLCVKLPLTWIWSLPGPIRRSTRPDPRLLSALVLLRRFSPCRASSYG